VQTTRHFHPLQHYPGFVDEELAIFTRFEREKPSPEPGFLIDFLGARTRATSLATSQREYAGQVLEIPVPGDYHAEAIEYLGLLKSVEAAKGQYVILELGAGWGPWLVSGALAARRAGISNIRLVGVEADPQHYEFMQQHLIDNNINPKAHRLLKAAIGAAPGRARWPKVVDAANDWGSRPARVEGNSIDVRDANYLPSLVDNYIEVEILDVADIISSEPLWDLVHIDVQGWETRICERAASLMKERVRFVIVGTHSRKHDGEIYDLFHRQGWLLENEKPTQMQFVRGSTELELMNQADGTQVWRNPHL
jgi:FkbM family methyltransferase